MKTWIKTVAKTIWTHRVTYAGLAVAYGCECAGLIDKETANQIATALYGVMATQKH